MYQLKLTRRAKKELKNINQRYSSAIDASLMELREDPFAGKPLTRELTGNFSYRVGVYRIIYKINKQDKIIYIVSAGHRSTVYR